MVVIADLEDKVVEAVLIHSVIFLKLTEEYQEQAVEAAAPIPSVTSQKPTEVCQVQEAEAMVEEAEAPTLSATSLKVFKRWATQALEAAKITVPQTTIQTHTPLQKKTPFLK